jgi:hypothetical protein
MPDDLALRAPRRGCHPCTVCCVRLPVPAGQISPGSKPGGIACRHLGATGCRIYGRRPSVCRGFRCAWLADLSWPVAWRPDLSGLLCLRETIADQLPAAAVYEVRPAALDSPLAAAVIAELQRTTAVVALIDMDERRRRLPGLAAPVTARPEFAPAA